MSSRLFGGHRSLTFLCEIGESLCGSIRTKFHGLLVPMPGLCNIGLDAHGAKLIEVNRVKGLAEHQRRAGTAGFGGTPQQNPSGSEIAGLEKATAAAKERVKFISTERQLDDAGCFCRWRFRRGDRRRPNLGTGHS
jgi:hypothetical protein